MKGATANSAKELSRVDSAQGTTLYLVQQETKTVHHECHMFSFGAHSHLNKIKKSILY